MFFIFRSASVTPCNSPQSSQQSVYDPSQQGGAVMSTPSTSSISTPPAAASSAQSLITPPALTGQSLSAPPTLEQPTWNPFGDDNFSSLTAEELLDKNFIKPAEGTNLGGSLGLAQNANTLLFYYNYVCVCVCKPQSLQLF